MTPFYTSPCLLCNIGTMFRQPSRSLKRLGKFVKKHPCEFFAVQAAGNSLPSPSRTETSKDKINRQEKYRWRWDFGYLEAANVSQEKHGYSTVVLVAWNWYLEARIAAEEANTNPIVNFTLSFKTSQSSNEKPMQESFAYFKLVLGPAFFLGEIFPQRIVQEKAKLHAKCPFVRRWRQFRWSTE